MTGVQLHNGNTVDDSEGCVLVGGTSRPDYVGDSVSAMKQINEIINKDGSGKITVTIKNYPSEGTYDYAGDYDYSQNSGSDNDSNSNDSIGHNNSSYSHHRSDGLH